MPKTFEKTRKQITKKKGGITTLHENSRNAQRLRAALGRDDKLQKLAASKRKHEQPLIQRVTFFQNVVRGNAGQPLEQEQLQSHIVEFIHQHDEEYQALKKGRRAGRPASAREDLLRMKIQADEKEYDNGFYVPDIRDAENSVLLERWEGSWPYLSTLKWVRITRSGTVQSTSFPPKGSS